MPNLCIALCGLCNGFTASQRAKPSLHHSLLHVQDQYRTPFMPVMPGNVMVPYM